MPASPKANGWSSSSDARSSGHGTRSYKRRLRPGVAQRGTPTGWLYLWLEPTVLQSKR